MILCSNALQGNKLLYILQVCNNTVNITVGVRIFIGLSGRFEMAHDCCGTERDIPYT